MRFICLAILAYWIYLPLPALGQEEQVFVSSDEAADELDFHIQGEYVGAKEALQVVALGNGKFQVVEFNGGLPGDGWDGQTPARRELTTDGVTQQVAERSLKRVRRSSPTLGREPPAGAIVLFDGSSESVREHWKQGAKLTKDGLLEQGATSLDTFQDYELHLEFRTPFKPFATGQQRGNSGVYHQGRYETQVLDSFGLEGKVNETGGIYSIRAPDLNMCFPPLTWQTYDVDFRAAKFDSAGKKTEDATLTVRLNGVLVQENVRLPKATTAAPVKEGPEPGPIFIQDHRNPVRFRNIWVLAK